MTSAYRSGWGKNSSIHATYKDLFEFDSFAKSISNNGLAVGLGRSYGDSSLNDSGISWTSDSLKVIKIFPDSKEAFCESGATLGELEREAVRVGLFPPVVPGTEHVTIGGAIASNIHGKSHHSYGSFADNVIEIELITSTGERKFLKPNDETADLFWATVGGLGLTGAILSVRLKLVPIDNPWIFVTEERVYNLEDLLATLDLYDKSFLYTVAWIDLSGSFKGRGLVSGGNHALNGEVKRKRLQRSISESPKFRSLPPLPPINFINRHTVRSFNEFWYRKPVKKGLRHYRTFLHPLDGVSDWNRFYGPNGFLQYQFAIPFGKEDFLSYTLGELRRFQIASFLGVLKKFGPSPSRFLSFPIPGWTLAIDIPCGVPGVTSLLRKLDDKLVQIGGRVYLTKDSRLEKEHFRQMYPEFEEWRTLKRVVDPSSYWTSMQAKRLGLL